VFVTLVAWTLFAQKAEGGLTGLLQRQQRGGGQECWTHWENSCPSDRFPKLVALERANNEEEAQRLLRTVPLREYCREIQSFIECYTNAIHAYPQQCDEGERDSPRNYLSIISQSSSLVNDICTDDIDTLQNNIVCLTDATRAEEVFSCYMDVAIKYYSGPAPGADSDDSDNGYQNDNEVHPCQAAYEVAYCFSQKLSAACGGATGKVYNKVLGRVVDIVKPICEKMDEPRRGGRPRELSELMNLLKMF